ncbi:hypothetical protein MMC08_008970, partial [Hypocenomyce scalaris]|nr:hypothetical protein [Hypocenomyce scalaris]
MTGKSNSSVIVKHLTQVCSSTNADLLPRHKSSIALDLKSSGGLSLLKTLDLCDVYGKAALITGGGSGICLEFTRKLLGRGCNVLIADLALRPEAEEVVESSISSKNGSRAVFKKTDVSDWKQLGHAFETAIKEFGRLDIVCPGAAVWNPAWSSFWHFDTGVDSVETSSYKTLDINISHPVRATQLAIDCFLRQKLGHGVVVIVTSVAAQTAVLAAPLYTLSKHAISGFTRSLADLEPRLNIRVNAVAPGSVKTPIWSEKLTWIDEEVDSWVPAERLAEVMLSLVRDANNVGGTILECGTDTIRRVEILNDPGPRGRGFSVANFNDGIESAYVSMEKTFGNKRQPYYCD